MSDVLRGRVYSLEGLDSSMSTAVSTAIQGVADLIDMQLEIRESRVKLRRLDDGLVDVTKIGTRSLDHLVDIHFFAIPMSNASDEPELFSPGASWPMTGVAFANVDTSTIPGRLSMITAHEVSHSIGFVRPEAGQSTGRGDLHCKLPSCGMFPLVNVEQTRHYCASSFCARCSGDLVVYGQDHINVLRHQRRLNKAVIHPRQR